MRKFKFLLFLFLFVLIFFVSGCDKTFTVMLVSEEGLEIEKIDVTGNKVIGDIETPVREGYTFVAWTYEGEIWNLEEDIITEDITLVATWEINYYNIIFDTKGGEEINSIEYRYGDKIGELPIPVRDGYEFVAWNEEVPDVMPAHDIELYAIWNVSELTIFVLGYDKEIHLNESFYLESYIFPLELPQEFIYESSDPNKLMISEDGMFTALEAGTVSIKIIAACNQEYFEQISITIKDYPKITSISIETQDNRNQVQIGTTLQCTVTGTPSAALEKATITWSVDNNALGSIDENGLLTAFNKTGIIRVIATADNRITASKAIRIADEPYVDYPDLGGYEIKIAQAVGSLGLIDPFMPESTKEQFGYYSGLDRPYRQEAWLSVEDDFNCSIKVVDYPAEAAWGPARWSYIIEQARLNKSQYDFYVVPDAQIPGLVSGNAIKDLTEYYKLYGHNMMNTITTTAGSYKGKLYSINTADPMVYAMLGYNYDLWQQINTNFPEIEEPAKLFNDGLWTYDKFVEYAIEVQTALDSLYPEQGYYAVSGWPTYYWVGMVDRNGVGVADVVNKQMNLTTPDSKAAGEALKKIYDAGAFDKAFNVDGAVESFVTGKSLFNTGDLWFIGTNQDRWPASINYGFVPFPAPNEELAKQYYIGTVSDEHWVMAEGRDNNYTAYGEECTAENIYRAIMEYFYRADKKYKNSSNYNETAQLEVIAMSKFGASIESMKAFVTISSNLDDYSFYDPLCSSFNTIVATYNSDLDKAIRSYVNGNSMTNNWENSLQDLQESLDEAINKAFS